MARRSLSPVSGRGGAAAITDANLHERLPVVTPHDELRGPAVVINSLLDRLERAFAQQRRFMADASHELRTPAAILNTEAQVTLSRPQRSEAGVSRVDGRDAAGGRAPHAHVDDLLSPACADEAHRVARLREPLTSTRWCTRSRAPCAHSPSSAACAWESAPVVDAPFHGDADLLGRLLLNLLDNAI
ncbi:MAG: hypothetical protein IPN47_12500, partial [Gemmatimonadetes bacterium]|nr:hypothetical protein [Gemmatimonadota bacterium]